MTITPIGTFHSDAKSPYEAGRQPMDRVKTVGTVILEKGQQYEQALEDLEGFDRIWLIYIFHQNPHWKPKVLPPRGSDKKVGVFATRAPYRPNPIGISCVRLLAVEGLRLTVEGADLLDGSPILDIKPYLPYAESFPESKIGWLEGARPYEVRFSATAAEQLRFLEAAGLTQLQDFVLNQLEYDPLNSEKKRVREASVQNRAVLAYKTWRIEFEVDEKTNKISVEKIFSGYSSAELREAETEDKYHDKKLHRDFIARNGNDGDV